MASTIKLRRGTASDWTTTDPVLALGEVGIETDTRKLKVGDGVSEWTELDYVFGMGSAPYDAGNKTGNATFDTANGTFQKAALTGNITLQLPTGGTEGKQLKLWLTPSGGDRTFNKVAGITLPSDSALSLPKTLTSAKRYRVLLECYDATHWDLISFVGGN